MRQHQTSADQARQSRLLARQRREAVVAAALVGGGGAFLRVHEAAAILGVSRCTLWAWSKKGILPPPVMIGGLARGWPAHVIHDLMTPRAA